MLTDSGKPLCDTEEAARMFGVRPDTVRKYVQRGQLVPTQTIGRAYLFTSDVLAEFKAAFAPRGKPRKTA